MVGGHANSLVSDTLGGEGMIEPLLPVIPVRAKGERPRVPDRAVLTEILFVLLTGLPMELL